MFCQESFLRQRKIAGRWQEEASAREMLAGPKDLPAPWAFSQDTGSSVPSRAGTASLRPYRAGLPTPWSRTEVATAGGLVDFGSGPPAAPRSRPAGRDLLQASGSATVANVATPRGEFLFGALYPPHEHGMDGRVGRFATLGPESPRMALHRNLRSSACSLGFVYGNVSSNSSNNGEATPSLPTLPVWDVHTKRHAVVKAQMSRDGTYHIL